MNGFFKFLRDIFFAKAIEEDHLHIDKNILKEPVQVMDKEYKKIEKEAGKLKKDVKKVEKKDKKRDVLVKKGKDAMKGKC